MTPSKRFQHTFTQIIDILKSRRHDLHQLQKQGDRQREAQAFTENCNSFDPQKVIAEAWARCRQLIDQENKLIADRINWLLLSQAALFGGFGFVYPQALQLWEKSSQSSSSPGVLTVSFSLMAFCLLGHMFCRIIYRAIHLAHREIYYTTSWYKYSIIYPHFPINHGMTDDDLDDFLEDIVCRGISNIPPLHLNKRNTRDHKMSTWFGTHTTAFPIWFGIAWISLFLLTASSALVAFSRFNYQLAFWVLTGAMVFSVAIWTQEYIALKKSY